MRTPVYEVLLLDRKIWHRYDYLLHHRVFSQITTILYIKRDLLYILNVDYICVCMYIFTCVIRQLVKTNKHQYYQYFFIYLLSKQNETNT